MKKVLWLIVCLMTMVMFTSCSGTYFVTANYDVCYPDGTRNYNGSVTILSKEKPFVACYSRNGTNFIAAINTEIEYIANIGVVSAKQTKKSSVIESSTAPMRLNSYEVKKVEKKNLRNKNNDVYY